MTHALEVPERIAAALGRRRAVTAGVTGKGRWGWVPIAYGRNDRAVARMLPAVRELLDSSSVHVSDLNYRVRRANPPPHLHVPRECVQLGVALDLTTECGSKRTTWEGRDVGGMVLACDADAIGRPKGTAAIYLLREEAPADDSAPPSPDAAETYRTWHRRDADGRRELGGLPDVIGVYIGRATRIGYRSDKWHKRGTAEDYDHDYTEPGYVAPEVWADHGDLAKAEAIVIVGGNQRVTAEGID